MIHVVTIPYTHGEVAWLNSLSHEEAIDLTASPRGSLKNAVESPSGGVNTDTDAGDEPLPVILRWLDVQAARKRCGTARDVLAMAQLRAQGVGEENIAAMFGTYHQAVNRRVRAAIRDLVNDLNTGVAEVPDRTSAVGMCLICGVEPRVRLTATKRRVRGGWKVIKPEKQASVCGNCLRSDLVFRVAA